VQHAVGTGLTGNLRLAEQALKALPKPRFDGPAHPFANDDIWR
jgi:hypothetical protein